MRGVERAGSLSGLHLGTFDCGRVGGGALAQDQRVVRIERASAGAVESYRSGGDGVAVFGGLQVVLVSTAITGGQIGADQTGRRSGGEATRRRPQIQQRWSEFTELRLVLRLRGVN